MKSHATSRRSLIRSATYLLTMLVASTQQTMGQRRVTVGVLSGQMKGDGTTGFGVSTISMVDSSEYHNLTAHGIDGLTINDDGTYSFDVKMVSTTESQLQLVLSVVN